MLCTQADIQNLFQVLFDTDPDPKLAAQIAAASGQIEHELGITVAEGSHTDTLDGAHEQDLWLPAWPVSDVDSVTEDGTALTVDVDYIWYPSGRIHRLGRTWSAEPKSIVVSYTAGYTATPQQLVTICARVAWRAFSAAAAQAAAGGPTGVKQETIDSYSVTYTDQALDAASGLELTAVDKHDLKEFRRKVRGRPRSVSVRAS